MLVGCFVVLTLLVGAVTIVTLAWPAGGAASHRVVADLVGPWMVACMIAAAALMVVLPSLVVRDWLLRRRLRSVLRGTGRCSQCRHSLVGLEVPESLEVTCPECGFVCRVDASLSELTLDARGRAMGRRMVLEPPPFWTRDRRRRWLRRTAITAGILLVTLGTPAVIHEWRLRSQASRARAVAPTSEELAELVRIHRPGIESKPLPSAIRSISRIAAQMREIAAREAPTSAASVPGGRVEIEYLHVLPDLPLEQLIGSNEDDLAKARAQVELVLRVIEAFEQGSVMAEIQELAATPPEVIDHGVPPSQLFTVTLPHLGEARSIGRMLAARTRLAIQRGDAATAERSCTAILAISRAIAAQSFLIDHLVAMALRGMTLAQLERWLASNPDEAELDAIERVLRAAAPTWDARLGLETESLMLCAMIAGFFAEPGNARFAPFLPTGLAAAQSVWGPAVKSLGTLESNLDALEAHRRYAAIASAWEPHERDRRTGGPIAPPSNAGLVATSAGFLSLRWIGAADDLLARERALNVQIALERWRLRHGEYPESLEALVPALLTALPLDPFSNRPFGYRRIDPPADPLGRPFLLWSVGADLIDDGGAVQVDSPIGVPWPGSPTTTPGGLDAILNMAPPIPRGTDGGGDH